MTTTRRSVQGTDRHPVRRAAGASDGDGDGAERGSVSVFVIGILLTLLLAIGLVYDGGQVLAARRQAITSAQAAARAAAATADPYDHVLDPAVAAQAAQRYLTAAGVAGAVAIGADAVTIDVTVTPRQVFFPMIGGTVKPAHGHAVAAIQLVPAVGS